MLLAMLKPCIDENIVDDESGQGWKQHRWIKGKKKKKRKKEAKHPGKPLPGTLPG